MKKLYILTLLFLTFTGLQVASAATFSLAFETYEGLGYDLTTGKAFNDINYSSTEKMVLGATIDNQQIELTNTNFHHLLFFDKYNRYIGYINGNQTTLENSKYLGYDADAITTIPPTAKFFTIVNYDYTKTRELTAVTNPTIDDIAWGSLTYRDIFGDSLFQTGANNIVNNGDFSIDSDSNGLADTWAGFSDTVYTLNNGIQQTVVTNNQYEGIAAPVTRYIYNHVYYLYFDYKAVGVWNVHLNNGIYQNVIPLIEDDTWRNINLVYTYPSDNLLGSHVLKFQNYTLNVETLSLDNVLMYDLTTLFAGQAMPTQEQFETMLDFYKLYVDAPETLTYIDIFGDSIYGSGKTNLIEYGDFSFDAFGWSLTNASAIFNSGVVTVSPLIANSYFALTQNGINFIDQHKYYSSYKLSFETVNDYVPKNFQFRYNNLVNIDFFIQPQEQKYSNITANTFGDRNGTYIRFIFDSPLVNTNDFFTVKEVMVYDLTSTFNAGLEPDQSTFESYYNFYLDPLDSSYNGYYTITSLDALTFSYDYTTGDAAELDADTGLNNLLGDINFTDANDKVFLSLVILIGIIAITGILSKNPALTFGVSGAAYSALVVFGWLPSWTLVIIGIIVMILAYLRFANIKG